MVPMDTFKFRYDYYSTTAAPNGEDRNFYRECLYLLQSICDILPRKKFFLQGTTTVLKSALYRP